MSQLERRFNAAVNVIRGLPKSGSYQPSNESLLTFYSCFKQVTLGPCKQSKPPFWDMVGRAKYDAYKALGNMPKERAMEIYVAELKRIIEYIALAGKSGSAGSVSELDGIDIGDLEAVAPEVMQEVSSRPNSPFASREASPMRNGHTNGISIVAPKQLLNGNKHFDESYHSGHSTEHSDEEYIDTVDDDSYLISEPILPTRVSRPTTRRFVQQARDDTDTFHTTNYQQIEPAINQILRTVELMNNDLQQINRRIDTIERLMATMENYQLKTASRYPRWWPFTDISPKWFVFLILWPMLANRLGKMLRKRSH